MDGWFREAQPNVGRGGGWRPDLASKLQRAPRGTEVLAPWFSP